MVDRAVNKPSYCISLGIDCAAFRIWWPELVELFTHQVDASTGAACLRIRCLLGSARADIRHGRMHQRGPQDSQDRTIGRWQALSEYKSDRNGQNPY